MYAAALVTRDDGRGLRPLGRGAGDAFRKPELVLHMGGAGGGTRTLLGRGGHAAPTLRAAEHVPQKLREALALACEGERPIRTVERLACAVGCDRRTLWNQWKQVVGRDEPLRLQDFLHWVLLLRAMSGKTAGRSWADVADDVGVHPHTLGRLARQLAGRTLRDLAAGGHAPVARRFEDEVLPVLLDGPRPRQPRRVS